MADLSLSKIVDNATPNVGSNVVFTLTLVTAAGFSDATNVVVESDYEMPGKIPGFIKDLMTKGWMERQGREMLADFKALAEAKVPAKA